MAQTIQIPFDGFYESVSDHLIDNVVDMAFDYEGTGMPDIPDDFWIKWNSKGVCVAYANLYVSMFNVWINEELGVDITLSFGKIVSPQFYNFETDRIFCTISEDDVEKLFAVTAYKDLEEVALERHSQRSGFVSFYSPDLKKAPWIYDVSCWDSVQLQTLLMAAMKSHGLELDVWGLMESCSGSGDLDNVVWGHCSKECLDMVNEYDAKHRKTA